MSPKNNLIRYNSVIYVSNLVTGVFLSYETMVELLIINRDFPAIGSQLPHQHSKVIANLNEKDQSKINSHEVTCSCPTRSKVSDKPFKLMFRLQMKK